MESLAWHKTLCSSVLRPLAPPEIRSMGRLQRRVIWGIALAGCLLRLFFWFYSGRTWEDALITVLHSENCAAGLGLTHVHPGHPPVHGFTSPLSVLIPLVADLVHIGWGLGFLRLVSALISIPTVLLAAAIASHRMFQLNTWLVYMLCGYLAFEHHQILWGMAGMETQVVVFVLFCTLYYALNENTRALGVCMALCAYARPDLAMFGALVAVYIFLIKRTELLRSIAIAAGVYAPWLIFTTLYYGSPVPNTIIAKGTGHPLWILKTPVFSAAFWNSMWGRVNDWIFLPLGPSFSGHGTGFLKFSDGGTVSRICVAIIALGIIALAFRFRKFYVLPVGYFLAYSAYYVFLVPGIFGWYLVPFSAMNCLLLVLSIGALSSTLLRPGWIGPAAALAGVAYVLPFLAIVPVTFKAEKDIQNYVENPGRKALGEYLRVHKAPGDTVGCEPLGYISYYSRMPVYDYPGLANREVTTFLKEHPEGHTLDLMLMHFRPDWIALRPYEYDIFLETREFISNDYQVEKAFCSESPGEVSKIFRIGSNVDRCFYLLKKVDGRPSVGLVSFSRLGRELTADAAIDGKWAKDGHDPVAGLPRADGAVYGSWNGNDGNVGRIRLGPFHVQPYSEIAIPVITGPDGTGQSVKILNQKNGTLVASLQLPLVRESSKWVAWRVAMPGDPDPAIEILAEDAGTGWGQWLAVGHPHLLSVRGSDSAFAQVGPVAAAGVTIAGHWARDGQYPAAGRPGVDGAVYGSWNGKDANVGLVRFGPFRVPQGATIAIPLVTGPDNTGQSVKAIDKKTGKPIASLSPVPLRDKWWPWKIEVPAGGDIEVEIVAEDAGTGWGQWLAAGMPHVTR